MFPLMSPGFKKFSTFTNKNLIKQKKWKHSDYYKN